MENKHAKKGIESTTEKLNKLKEKFELDKPRRAKACIWKFLFDLSCYNVMAEWEYMLLES